MKLFSRSFVLFAVCLSAGLLITVSAQEPTKTTPGVEWQRYELGKGTFTALFPAKPTEEFTPSPAAAEMAIDLYVYSVSTPNGVFVAQYAHLGAEAEKWPPNSTTFYDGVWKGIKESFDERMVAAKSPQRTELLQTRSAKFAGSDGRELVFNLGQFKGRVLMTRIRRHAYVAMVMRTEKMELADEDNSLNSFVLKVPEPVKTLDQ